MREFFDTILDKAKEKLEKVKEEETLDVRGVLNLIDKLLLEYIDTYEDTKQVKLKEMLLTARSLVLCDILYKYNDDTLRDLGPQWSPKTEINPEEQGYYSDKTQTEIVQKLLELEPKLKEVIAKQVPISAAVLFGKNTTSSTPGRKD